MPPGDARHVRAPQPADRPAVLRKATPRVRLLPLSGRLALVGLSLLLLAGACAALRWGAAAGAAAGLGAALVGGYLVLSARALTRTLATASTAQARTARRQEDSARDLAGRLESLGDDVAALRVDLSALRDEVATLRSGVRTVGTEVAAADARGAHQAEALLSEVGGLRARAETASASLGAAATDLADLRRRVSAPAPARQGWDELARLRRPGACLVLLRGEELAAALEGADETTPVVVGAEAEAVLAHGTPHTVGGVLFSLDDAAGLSEARLAALTAGLAWLRPGVPVLGVGRHAVLLDGQAGALADRAGHAVAPQRVGPHVVRLAPVGPPTFTSVPGGEG